MKKKPPKFPKIEKNIACMKAFEQLCLKDRVKIIYWVMAMHIWLFERDNDKTD